MDLTSKLFKGNQQLQDCANLDSAHIVADEPPLRRGVNAQGAHVALIHQALREVMPSPSFGLEEATETYGPKTAEVVRQFKAKQNPPILNAALRQTVPDNIVGKQTIAALDAQVGRKKPAPAVPPPAAPENLKRRMVSKKTVQLRTVVRPPQDLDPASGGVGFQIGSALNQGVIDALRMGRNPIEGSDFDDGQVESSQLGLISSDLEVMKTVDIAKEVRRLPSIVKPGVFEIRFNVVRVYRYTYGVGSRSNPVRVSTTTTIIDLDPNAARQVLQETRFTAQDHRTYNREGKAFFVGETFSGLPFEKGVELVDELKRMIPKGLPLAQFAIRWLLDQPAVSTVIAGVTKPAQLAENVLAARRDPLDPDLVEELKDWYERKVRPFVRGHI